MVRDRDESATLLVAQKSNIRVRCVQSPVLVLQGSMRPLFPLQQTLLLLLVGLPFLLIVVGLLVLVLALVDVNLQEFLCGLLYGRTGVIHLLNVADFVVSHAGQVDFVVDSVAAASDVAEKRHIDFDLALVN